MSTADPLASFAEAVRAYRAQTGASVTSWGRTEAHNRAVGGVLTSYHLQDLAVDVVYDRPIDGPTAAAVATGLGLRLIRERTHDHLEPLTTGGP